MKQLICIFTAAFMSAGILVGFLVILLLVLLVVRFPPLLFAVLLTCWILGRLQRS